MDRELVSKMRLVAGFVICALAVVFFYRIHTSGGEIVRGDRITDEFCNQPDSASLRRYSRVHCPQSAYQISIDLTDEIQELLGIGEILFSAPDTLVNGECSSDSLYVKYLFGVGTKGKDGLISNRHMVATIDVKTDKLLCLTNLD